MGQNFPASLLREEEEGVYTTEELYMPHELMVDTSSKCAALGKPLQVELPEVVIKYPAEVQSIHCATFASLYLAVNWDFKKRDQQSSWMEYLTLENTNI